MYGGGVEEGVCTGEVVVCGGGVVWSGSLVCGFAGDGT